MEECGHCARLDTLNGETGLCYECMVDKTSGRGSVTDSSQVSLTDSQNSEIPTPCICEHGAMTVKAMMQCVNCKKWWHPSCVGLPGLTKTHTKCIKDWKCPCCFTFKPVLSVKIKQELNVFTDDEVESSDLQQEVRKGVKQAVPDIISGIMEAFTGENVPSFQEETYAQVTQRKKLIKEVVQETSKTALQESIQLIDANLTEQRKRVRNAVISLVEEDYGAEGSSLKEVAVDLLGDCSPHDIVTVKRLGEKQARSKRPILVVFKNEEAAQYFHNYGRGRKVHDRFWINPDLTSTEREVQYKKRQARRDRMRNRLPVRATARRGSEAAEALASSDNHQESLPPVTPETPTVGTTQSNQE